MMAITVFAIGASGVISLQKVAVTANRNARSIAVANEVASTWMERLRTDALLWNYPSPSNPVSDLDIDTTWLSNSVSDPDPGPAAWFRPKDERGICGIHDVFGRDEYCESESDNQGPYCVNLRLSWVREDRRMIRAEVRVFWIVNGAVETELEANDFPCGNAENPPNVDVLAEKGMVRVVHAVTALTKNEAP
jgi:hypothetical protein